MRVLVVITRGEPGGAQVHVLELLRGLQRFVSFTLALGDEEFLAQEARALGIDVRGIPSLQRSVSPRADVRTVRALAALVREVRPHLVHTHSTKAGLLGRAAARLAGVPALHTAHAWSFSDGLSWGRKAFAVPVEAAAGRITDRFIVVSEADREIALRYHVARPEQVAVVHNGVVDVADRAAPDAPGEPVLTMVARMAAPKDHALLLRAMAESSAAFRLRLVGDGPGRPELERLAGELGIAARVEWVGVSREVPALLAGSSAFALISRQEGFPLAVLEGMRAGLPVIASDVGGIREAVTDGVTGALVPRGDVAALRKTLDRLMSDPVLRRSWGAAGRARFVEAFTVDQMLAHTVAVYRELAAAHGAPPPAAP